jgi:class 3 adenylate cyclase
VQGSGRAQVDVPAKIVAVDPPEAIQRMSAPESKSEVTSTAEFDAIALRQGPPDARSQLSDESIEELLQMGSTPIEAVVVVGDLRMSSLVLKEAIQPSLFARFIVGFTEAVRGLANASGGWFDKFTGDGFVAFWIPPKSNPVDATNIPEFCRTVLSAADALLSNLRRNSRNFPAGTGLSIGIDAGPCELVRVGELVTLVGSPIVGASRMVAGAAARQTILNIYFGSALEREASSLATDGIRLVRTVVRTKEYPEGQEAFELVFPTASISASPGDVQ